MEDLLLEADLGHKIPATLPLVIRKQELIFKGEVDIGLRPTNIPPITNVKVVDCCIFQEILLVVMGELYICPRPATITPK